jgi:NTE family protein
MNAAALCSGLAGGGRREARQALADLWRAVALTSRPGWWRRRMIRTLMPRRNPVEDDHPLRPALASVLDLERVREAPDDPRLFVAMTRVLDGRVRIVPRAELSLDAVLASSAIPHVFPAVEVDGEPCWDGALAANPPIYPLIYAGGAPDIVVVQLSGGVIDTVPYRLMPIINRMVTLGANLSLMRELRVIDFVTGLIDRGELDATRHQRLNMHLISLADGTPAERADVPLDADWGVVRTLHQRGVRAADDFLRRHRDDLGRRTTLPRERIW